MTPATSLSAAPFRLSLRFDPAREAASGDGFRFEVVGLHDFRRLEDAGGVFLVWGFPVLDGRAADPAELMRRLRDEGAEALARELDCGFVLAYFDRGRRDLTLITDRWSSLPLFYGSDGGCFRADSSFKRLFDGRGAGGSPGLDRWTVAEFFYFRRVFGERTYDQGIRFLPYAAILTVDAEGRTDLRRYWRIGAEKSPAGQNAMAERLAAALRYSMRVHTSDGHRYGLMLSGGAGRPCFVGCLAAGDAVLHHRSQPQ